MLTPIYDLCLKWQEEEEEDEGKGRGNMRRRNPEEEHDSGILSDAARLCCLVRFLVFFEPQRYVRQRLPRLGLFGFPPKLLTSFLRGFVVATARGLVVAPASRYVTARGKLALRNRIFGRAMSGFVMREERRLQAAAAARIADKRLHPTDQGIIPAAQRGDVADVLSYLISDANCVNARDV
jgi:hypothetical protein